MQPMGKVSIAVISCGGTIGMEPSKNNGLLEPKKSIDEILGEVNLSSLADKINISPENKIELFKLDSSNLNPTHWKKLIDTIEALQNQCDGIVVFHGTDTMAYSATASGLALATKIKVPVIFTGAQKPIGETGDDARSNVERAFLVLDRAIRDGTKECMVFFGDSAYRGVNSKKINEAGFKAFESPAADPLYITDGIEIKAGWLTRKEQDVSESRKRIGVELRNEFADGIITLSVVPGLEGDSLIALAERDTTKVIILKSLGVGCVPGLEGKFDLVTPIKKIVNDFGKPIIVISPFIGGDINMNVYAVSELARKAGAIGAGKMTEEAVSVKSRLILAQPEFSELQSFKKALLTDFAGETGAI